MPESKDEGIVSKPSIDSERPLSLYPFVPGKYGLDFSELKRSFIGFIPSGSGKRVHGIFEDIGAKTAIRIDDNEDEGFALHADVNGDTLKFSLYTRKINGERHPDFFAKNFVAFALNYFEEQGHQINRIEANWTHQDDGIWPSDNLDEYFKNRREGMSKEEAARNTWSGRTYTGLGFTEIEDYYEEEEGEEVKVIFRKPGSQSL